MTLPKTGHGLRRERRDLERVLSGLTAGEASTAERRGETLFCLGEVLLRLKRFEDADNRFGEAAKLLWRVPGRRGVAVVCLSRRMTALSALGRNEEALAIAEGLLGPCPRVRLAAFPDVVPGILLHRVALLEQLGRDDEEVHRAAVAVLEIIEPKSTPFQRYAAAYAWRTEARIASARGERTRALAACNNVAELTTEESDDSLVKILSEVMLMKGTILEAAGRNLEAVWAYDAVATRFGNASKPDLRQRAVEAAERAAALR